MKKEIGCKSFDIWILGDSNPINWESTLDSPFDSRHPIRHNIITSVFDFIQENVYLDSKLRVDSRKIFIRNAIENPLLKPRKRSVNWSDQLNNEIKYFRNDLKNHKPKFLLTFGSFSFEFARRCLEESEEIYYSFWDTKKLGEEFFKRIAEFNLKKTNIIPMLHRSIAGGNFLKSHDLFCKKIHANYFEETGNVISSIILQNKKVLNIWCKLNS
jgi:hypothetical protein